MSGSIDECVFNCCKIVVNKLMSTNLFGAVLINYWLIVAVTIDNVRPYKSYVRTYNCTYVKTPFLRENCGTGLPCMQ